MKGSTGAKTGVLALILALLPTILFAAVVRISWNANTESDLEGYRVFYGASSGNYPYVINVGNKTTIDVSGLSESGTYYFAVTAFDFSGNESDYSLETSVSIPAESSDDGSLADDAVDVVEWLEQVVRNIFGLDPDVPVYALGDFGTVDTTTSPNPSGSVVTQGFTDQGSSTYAALCDLYPVQDAILEAGIPYDLSSIYPLGSYLFYPLDSGCPDFEGDLVTAEQTGMFLYVVFDESSSVDHLLRLSVAEEIYELYSYNPASARLFEDRNSGIVVDLAIGATDEIKPIAIGWGGFEAFAGAAVLATDTDSCYIDILPYGLELISPAVISLPFDGTTAEVLRYDDESGQWMAIEDVQVSQGYLSFSSQTLGRFVVTAAQEGTASEDEPYEGRDGSCFVTASHGQETHGMRSLCLLLISALITWRCRSLSGRKTL